MFKQRGFISLQENSQKYLEQKCRSIVPIGLLYVGQREMAATTPDDGMIFDAS